MEKEKNRYIGPRKILFVVEEKFKTNAGNDIVTVNFDGGKTLLMPKRSYEFLVSDKPTDFTELGRKNMSAIVREMLALLAEHHFTGDDIDKLTIQLSNELMNSFNKATHILWMGESNTFTPGDNPVLERSLLEADTIIKTTPDDNTKQPKEEDNN